MVAGTGVAGPPLDLLLEAEVEDRIHAGIENEVIPEAVAGTELHRRRKAQRSVHSLHFFPV